VVESKEGRENWAERRRRRRKNGAEEDDRGWDFYWRMGLKCEGLGSCEALRAPRVRASERASKREGGWELFSLSLALFTLALSPVNRGPRVFRITIRCVFSFPSCKHPLSPLSPSLDSLLLSLSLSLALAGNSTLSCGITCLINSFLSRSPSPSLPLGFRV